MLFDNLYLDMESVSIVCVSIQMIHWKMSNKQLYMNCRSFIFYLIIYVKKIAFSLFNIPEEASCISKSYMLFLYDLQNPFTKIIPFYKVKFSMNLFLFLQDFRCRISLFFLFLQDCTM